MTWLIILIPALLLFLWGCMAIKLWQEKTEEQARWMAANGGYERTPYDKVILNGETIWERGK